MLLTCACDQSAIEASESLVGAKELPSARELSGETIQINRGFGDIGWNFLSYELRPDGTLTVTHTDRRVDKVLGKETFRLSSDVAQRARRLLWRVRPAKLEGVEYVTRPSGCEPTGPHDFGELAVAFIDEREERDVNNPRAGAFELPTPDSCGTPEALEARKLVRQVFQLFPHSKVAAAYAKSS